MSIDLAGKPYEPSNGSEGEWFEAQFCDRCKHEDAATERWCDIHTRAFWCDRDDPTDKYPSEWVYDIKGHPTCTAFEFKAAIAAKEEQ